MSPSLYDLLDVDESASADEIRTAWKTAIADLGPTDRRFRAYNQAAEVLLDPEQRAAYDAERAADDPEHAPDASEEPGPVGPEARPARTSTTEDRVPGGDGESEPEEDDVRRAPRWTPAPWMAGVVAAVAFAVLAATVLVWAEWYPAGAASDDALTDGAVDAAVEAAPQALAYDYRSFDEDISAAQDLMTSEQRARHNELMADLRSDVVSQKAVVESRVVGSGLIRGDEDRADVLVFVNQHTTKQGGGGREQEVLIPLWVRFEMVRQDGEWLLDRMVNEGVVASSGESTPGGEPSPSDPTPSDTESPGE